MSDTFVYAGKTWKVATCTVAKLTATPAASGSELRAIREKKGLNTREMANLLGISQSKLVKLENNQQWRNLPSVLDKAKRLP